MSTTNKEKNTPRTVYLPVDLDQNKPLRLRFFGDVHYSSQGCDRELFHEVLSRWEADPENAYYISMGDLNDFASYSERDVLSHGALHDQTVVDLNQIAENHLVGMVGKCLFMRDRFIGSVEGNHTWKFVNGQFDGMTADQAFAAQLGGTWLGGFGLARVGVGFKGRNSRASVDIALHHGKAGGQTPGNSINQIDKMQKVVDADIYAMGHNHQLHASHGYSKLSLSSIGGKGAKGDRVEGIPYLESPKLLVRTGSFFKAYEVDVSSYIVDRLYPAAQLGAVEVEVWFKRSRRGGEDRVKKVFNPRLYQ